MQAESNSSDANTNPILRATSMDDGCLNTTMGLSLIACSNSDGCLTLLDILKSFNAAISEEQAWALIYQSVKLYRDYCKKLFDIANNDKCGTSSAACDKVNKYIIEIPLNTGNFRIHKDGTVHVSVAESGE